MNSIFIATYCITLAILFLISIITDKDEWYLFLEKRVGY